MDSTREETPPRIAQRLRRTAALGAVGLLGLTACGGDSGGEGETFTLTYTT